METQSETIRAAREELARISRISYSRGLSSGTSGNISVRVPGDMALIKASGSSFGEAVPDDFVLVDLEGNLVEGDRKPSKEVYFHCGIYRERPDVGAVFHGHSAFATAYVSAFDELPMFTAASGALLKRAVTVPFAPAGSPELARYVTEAFADRTLSVCMLKKHGFVTVAETLEKSFCKADVLEDNAKVLCLMKMFRP